jgi:hypothetical protein
MPDYIAPWYAYDGYDSIISLYPYDYDSTPAISLQIRITSPPTKSWWKRIMAKSNCDGLTLTKVTYILKTSITHTVSTTETWKVEEKYSEGLKALDLIMQEDTTLSFEWSKTDLYSVANEVTLELHKDLQPGYKWEIFQLVGEASYIQIMSEQNSDQDIKC